MTMTLAFLAGIAVGFGGALCFWFVSEMYGWAWPTRPLLARPKKLPPATARAIRRNRHKSRLEIRGAAQRWIAAPAEYFDREDTLS